jgi:hypothetical protein
VFPPWKSHRKKGVRPAYQPTRPDSKKIAVKRHLQRLRLVGDLARAPDTQKRSLAFEKELERSCSLELRIKVVKYSPVSTGQLRRLLALHHQPINLVVFQGAFGPKSNET